MHIDRLRWIRAIALLTAVTASGCQQMFRARSDTTADPFTARLQAPPDDDRVGHVQPVSYDERADSAAAISRQVEDELGIADFAPHKLNATFKKLTGRGPDQEEAVRLYHEAEAQFKTALNAAPEGRRSEFDAAGAKYAAAAERWPDSALEENSLMMVGESKFFADRYPKAESAYESLIAKYPNTRHMDTVAARRFGLAQWWLEKHKKSPKPLLQPNFTDDKVPRFDTFGSAARLYDKIRLDDPTGKLADDATMAAAGAFFEAGKYLHADRFYEDLRKSFPNSPHQFRAHLLGVMCKLKIYQGPDYNGKPLEEAEKLIEQTYRQFPDHVAQEREHLQKAFREVRAMQAERRHHFAKYYERRGEYGGARYYYQRIAEEFPNTRLAETARGRLEELADRPNRPPQRMEWLVNLFPDPPLRGALIPAGDEHPVTRFLYDPLSVARSDSYSNGTNSHLR